MTVSSKQLQNFRFNENIVDTDSLNSAILSIDTDLSSLKKDTVSLKYDVNSINNMTKLEVYPTSAAIPAGTVDDVTGLEYKVEVPAQMTAKFTLKYGDLSNATIDWGDGTASSGSDFTSSSQDQLIVSHEYKAQGRYVVTFIGDFCGIKYVDGYNLVSRIFASDLPISPKMYNVSDLCHNALRLQKVYIPYQFKWPNDMMNFYGMFNGAVNLISFTNMATSPIAKSCDNMFNGCSNLSTVSFDKENIYNMPICYGGRYSTMYYGCSSLVTPLTSLIPPRGFYNAYVYLTGAFGKCSSISGGIGSINNALWDSSTKFNNTNIFSDLPESVRANIPAAWGGTLAS